MTLLRQHASHILEHSLRNFYPDTSRYWEQEIELDAVRFNPKDESLKSIIISEIKYRILSDRDRIKLKIQLHDKFKTSNLSKKYELYNTEILDRTDVLEKIATAKK